VHTKLSTNNIYKKFLSINQSPLFTDYANITMQRFKKTLMGFGDMHINFFSKKFEKHPGFFYENFHKNYKFFIKIISLKFPSPIALHKKHTLNVYVLDLIQSYRGSRHIRGLPVRGQRT